MANRTDATQVARYFVFETLEALLALATVLMSLGCDIGALYLFRSSQETLINQQIAPGASQLALLCLLAAFRLSWYFAFYLWRRRGGLVRLLGQCAVLLPPAAAALLWGALAYTAVRMYESVFFIAVPCIFCGSALAALVMASLPVPALIRFRRRQVEMSKKSIL